MKRLTLLLSLLSLLLPVLLVGCTVDQLDRAAESVYAPVEHPKVGPASTQPVTQAERDSEIAQVTKEVIGLFPGGQAVNLLAFVGAMLWLNRNSSKKHDELMDLLTPEPDPAPTPPKE